MTRHVILNLDLNENDFDALSLLLTKPHAVAQLLAPGDVRQQSRVIDVLTELRGAMGHSGNQLDMQLKER